MIWFSVGISGCGKTTYGNKLKEKIKDLEIICPDDIREQLTGDVSDQSLNSDVFNITNSLLEAAIKNNKNVYYSATNLTSKSRKFILECCKKYNRDCIAVVFLTSLRPDICEERVRSDLSCGIKRSNTLVKTDDGNVIRTQWKKFLSLSKDISVLENQMNESCKEWRIKYVECSES